MKNKTKNKVLKSLVDKLTDIKWKTNDKKEKNQFEDFYKYDNKDFMLGSHNRHISM